MLPFLPGEFPGDGKAVSAKSISHAASVGQLSHDVSRYFHRSAEIAVSGHWDDAIPPNLRPAY